MARQARLSVAPSPQAVVTMASDGFGDSSLSQPGMWEAASFTFAIKVFTASLVQPSGGMGVSCLG